jgi:predicted tellurium resistance membrane protein TerC
MDWLTSPEAWISLVTLTLLEIVLGIDNIVFISILAGKLPREQQKKARQLGLTLAIFEFFFGIGDSVGRLRKC